MELARIYTFCNFLYGSCFLRLVACFVRFSLTCNLLIINYLAA